VTQAVRFLSSFGRALSMSSLYRAGHPTLERALDAACTDLQDLLAVVPQPTFTFLGGNVLFADVPLSDRRQWEWSSRLSDCGIQRVQFEAPIDRERFVAFLLDVNARLAGHPPASAPPRPGGPGGIRLGAVGLRDAAPPADAPIRTATLDFTLDAEIDTARWVQQETCERQAIPLLEVEAVVRSLSVAMHSHPQMVLPLVQLREFDQYTTTHSLNVSVLGMGLGERLGLAAGDVRAYGVAGLLHDIGKTQIPLEVLNKPGRLTESERDAMNRHPADGARLILESNKNLDLAAVVAYEHHIMIDGGGYPQLRYRRPCHDASRLIHVCDVFDALRTHRPYRDAWPLERTYAYLRERAGLEFDAHLVEPFVAMIEGAGSPLTETEGRDTVSG
jgi:putative nucleotidyltransferase with HDIG domain